jgi:S-adenosylmethionine:diacylglycerol 3-amino-3-carboxypropyl transferase
LGATEFYLKKGKKNHNHFDKNLALQTMASILSNLFDVLCCYSRLQSFYFVVKAFVVFCSQQVSGTIIITLQILPKIHDKTLTIKTKHKLE